METLAAGFMSDTAVYPRIYVDKNENVILNGNPSSIENVDVRLQEVKARNGIVLYSMDNAKADPPKEGIVIDLIKKYRVHFRMYADKSFSKPFD